MYFEIDEFLKTLSGFTRVQTSKMITLQQDELMYEGSKPKLRTGQTVVFRSFRSEIDFLNKLGNEVAYGLVVQSTVIDRNRIDTVLKNLNN
jgi:hypothetical protein